MARLVAVAFREAVSVQRLEEIFRSDWNQLFAGTTVGHCPKGRRQFAVFFPASCDPENLEHLKSIEEMLAKDCRDGKHVTEISLTRG